MEESTSSGFGFFLPAIAVVSLAAQVYADEGGDWQAGMTLTAGEIDSSTAKVGAFAAVVHGLGERHPVSGAWEQLKTDRGYIVAIGAETLIPGLGRDEWPEVITLERIQTLVLPGTPVLEGVDRDSTEVDSSRTVSRLRETPDGRSMGRVKERHRPFDIEDAGLRRLAKVAAGTASGIFTTVIVANVIATDSRTMGGHYLGGAAIGSSVGFPLGVSSVDPYDSLSKTLLAGVIPAAVGIGSVQFRNIQGRDMWFFAFGMAYVIPVIGSLIASELSRDFSQDRHISLGVAPIPNGALSVSTTLHF